MPNPNSQPAAQRILLLTATITPPQGAPELVRTDPKLRLADYDAALAFYITLVGQCIDRIIFAENSNSDVAILKQRCAQSGKQDAVEFISFYGLDYPPEYGRGYGEMRLIDHAIEHSQTIAQLGQKDIVWKMTGRYICRNLPAMIRSAPPAFDLYCDLKDRPMPWMDLRLFAFTKAGYDRLLHGVYTKLSRAHLKAAPEKEMRNHVGGLLPAGQITPRFRKEPLIDGIRGNDGRNYSNGKNLAKFVVRSAARKIAPFLWI